MTGTDQQVVPTPPRKRGFRQRRSSLTLSLAVVVLFASSIGTLFVPKRVQRGGSFLCSDAYCVRYRPGARGKGDPDSGASHIGFRCVKSAD